MADEFYESFTFPPQGVVHLSPFRYKMRIGSEITFLISKVAKTKYWHTLRVIENGITLGEATNQGSFTLARSRFERLLEIHMLHDAGSGLIPNRFMVRSGSGSISNTILRGGSQFNVGTDDSWGDGSFDDSTVAFDENVWFNPAPQTATFRDVSEPGPIDFSGCLDRSSRPTHQQAAFPFCYRVGSGARVRIKPGAGSPTSTHVVINGNDYTIESATSEFYIRNVGPDCVFSFPYGSAYFYGEGIDATDTYVAFMHSGTMFYEVWDGA